MVFIGLVMALVIASRRETGLNKDRPAWAEHLQGWRGIFVLAAFLAALVIIMNPELLALGLLGDAAFFDALVLALSFQFQGLVFNAGRRFQSACSIVLSAVIRRKRRVCAMFNASVSLYGEEIREIWKFLIKSIRQRENTLAL